MFSLRRILNSPTSVKNFRTLTQKAYQEIRIPVPWGYIAGKWWGPTDKRPVLVLHGWQDNCGSFDRMIPLLNGNLGYLAVDFPGHGYSSRLPPGAYYHFINYIILVRQIVSYFQWHKVSLLGHSLGGVTSFLYGSMFPQNVDFAIVIDLLKPSVTGDMGEKIDDFLKLEQYAMDDSEPPTYDMEEIIKKVCEPHLSSIHPEHSHNVIKRNVAPSVKNPGKYYFTRDPRLKARELYKFVQSESLVHASKIMFPIFIAKATGSRYYEPKEDFHEVVNALKKTSKDCDFHFVEGTHHLHLNNPEKLASLVNLFMERNDIEDRSQGGIKEEMKMTHKQSAIL